MTVSLTIPAEYVDDFRDAVVYEIENGTSAVETQRKAIRRSAEWRDDSLERIHDDDMRLAHRLLAQDGTLLAYLENADDEEPFAIPADVADAPTLAHACHAMARKVVAPRVRSLLNYGPLDTKIAAALNAQLARLSWAIESSARLVDGDAGTAA
jgi:hypothetical protein